MTSKKTVEQNEQKHPYEAPELVVIGTGISLTQADLGGPSDGLGGGTAS